MLICKLNNQAVNMHHELLDSALKEFKDLQKQWKDCINILGGSNVWKSNEI